MHIVAINKTLIRCIKIPFYNHRFPFTEVKQEEICKDKGMSYFLSEGTIPYIVSMNLEISHVMKTPSQEKRSCHKKEHVIIKGISGLAIRRNLLWQKENSFQIYINVYLSITIQ